MQKYVPLVKQNVMKLEVFILGGQRIEKRIRDGGDEREKRDWSILCPPKINTSCFIQLVYLAKRH